MGGNAITSLTPFGYASGLRKVCNYKVTRLDDSFVTVIHVMDKILLENAQQLLITLIRSPHMISPQSTVHVFKFKMKI